MNLKLNYEGFEKDLEYDIYHNDLNGIQYVFRFRNDYGASVIKSEHSYGHEKDLWLRLAVIKFYGPGKRQWYLIYNTPIMDDVIGNLTDEEIRDLLKKIKEL